jgi:hypothetical protein
MAGIEAGKTWSRIGAEVAPTDSAASGVWGDLNEVAENVGAGTWPTHIKGTMELIAEFVGGSYPGVSGDVAFTGIPQTYRSLRIVMANGKRAAAGDTFGLTFNGDTTTANYSYCGFYNTSTNATYSTMSSYASYTTGNTGPTAAGSCFWTADITNYADSSVGTAAQIEQGFQQAGTGAAGFSAFGYNQTSAVTSLTLRTTTAGSNYYFFEPTVVALYGIGLS